jgi:hypothetical protein
MNERRAIGLIAVSSGYRKAAGPFAGENAACRGGLRSRITLACRLPFRQNRLLADRIGARTDAHEPYVAEHFP